MTDNKYSLDSLIAFLQSKPSDEPYDSADAQKCLLAQWAHTHGDQFNTDAFVHEHGNSLQYGEHDLTEFQHVVFGNDYRCGIVADHPETAGNTFGQALKRALIMKQELEHA